MKIKKTLGIIAFAIGIYLMSIAFKSPTQEKWKAPASADKTVNPIKNDPKSVASGKKIYKMLCSVCHGPKGKGDGMGGTGLTPKPADLTNASFQSQSDGAIFWKIEEGRSPMPTYKTSIPEKKKWEIINYLRTLKK